MGMSVELDSTGVVEVEHSIEVEEVDNSIGGLGNNKTTKAFGGTSHAVGFDDSLELQLYDIT